MVNNEILAEIQVFHSSSCPGDSIIDVYGSCAYSTEEKQSDIDLFLLASSKDDIPFAPFLAFIHDMHMRHGRKIDNEVPFENKLIYDRSEILAATALEGFGVDPVTQLLTVAPVRKTIEFLSSREMKLRLVLNALTTPQLLIGSRAIMVPFWRNAEVASTLLGISLHGEKHFGCEEVLNALCTSKSGQDGEMHLGYKPENQLVLDHMLGFIDHSLSELSHKGIIRANGHMFVRPEIFKPQEIAKEYTYGRI